MTTDSRKLADISSVEGLAMGYEREAERMQENARDLLKRIIREANDHLETMAAGYPLQPFELMLAGRAAELRDEVSQWQAATKTAAQIRKCIAKDAGTASA